MQYDIYHAAASSRDIPADLKRFARQLVHVQFADHPGRHEPGTGSLPLAEYFELLGQIGYCGYLGAEYKPNRALDESLGWIRAYSTEHSICAS
jgi:hydroxypyruvate isomerase